MEMEYFESTSKTKHDQYPIRNFLYIVFVTR